MNVEVNAARWTERDELQGPSLVITVGGWSISADKPHKHKGSRLLRAVSLKMPMSS